MPIGEAAVRVFTRWVDGWPAVERNPPRAAYGICALVVLAAVLALSLWTQPLYLGDTHWLVGDMVGAVHGDAASSNRLWEFAHVLWRPLGLVLGKTLLPSIREWTGLDDDLAMTSLLVGVNLLAAAVCAFLTAAWALRITGSALWSCFAGVCFLFTNAVLNISRSGVSYLLGLTCLVGAVYLVSSWRKETRWVVWGAGVLAGFAVLFWMPYVLTIPAVGIALVLNARGKEAGGEREVWNALVRFCFAAGGVVAVGYGVAAIGRGIDSWTLLAQWIQTSAHTKGRENRLLRMAFGLPRSFVEMGSEGILFKRFLFHDPYAPVHLADLVRASLGKVALFYASLLAFAGLLWTHRAGRRHLLLLAAVALPNLVLATAFESGSIERYLCIFPFLFTGAALVLAQRQLGRAVVGLLVTPCLAMVVGNAMSLSTATVAALQNREGDRMQALSGIGTQDLVYVLNNQDNLATVPYNAPFRFAGRKLPQFSLVMPYAAGHTAAWRAEFADAVLRAWHSGSAAWVTRRVTAVRPEPDWNWVEGDDSRISWAAVHAFFEPMQWAETQGGQDGFLRLEDGAHNRALLARASEAAKKPAGQ